MQQTKVYSIRKIKVAEPSTTFPNNNLWKSAESLHTFHQPWRQEKCPEILFKALHDDEYLYLKYVVQDAHVLLYDGDNGKMDVTQSDRVEIFISADPQLQSYYCLEIDPSGRILDYSASYHREFDYQWTWPDGHIFVTADIGSTDYQVDIRISKHSLNQLGLIHNNAFYAGIYLGHCVALPDEGKQNARLNWLTWIDPLVEDPDFHVPSSFGILELT
ncbi:MAG: sugar-binding protein [Allomuricauda sp.]